MPLLQARVEGITQAVAEQVKAQHGDEDGETGTEDQPGVILNPGDVGL